MSAQTTLLRSVRVSGPGLHGGRRATVTLHPAPADHGRRLVLDAAGGDGTAADWRSWTPSRMSTTLQLPGGRLRTVEHLMAALSAHGVDNVRIAVRGNEVPIRDGSARPWCEALRRAGLARLTVPREVIRLRRPVQIDHAGGFLRAEPADAFVLDVTHDLLSGFPVLRWRGPVTGAAFDAELAASRSFGDLYRRLGRAPPPRASALRTAGAQPNRLDPAVPITPVSLPEAPPGAGPLLRGWRPWRATVVVGGRVLPWPRFPDEPVRHVALDMIGDLALLGAPLLGRVVAHNPSHEKTYALVAAIRANPDAWDLVREDGLS